MQDEHVPGPPASNESKGIALLLAAWTEPASAEVEGPMVPLGLLKQYHRYAVVLGECFTDAPLEVTLPSHPDLVTLVDRRVLDSTEAVGQHWARITIEVNCSGPGPFCAHLDLRTANSPSVTLTVTANVLRKGQGTPTLRNHVKCLGPSPGFYGTDHETDFED